MNRLDPIEFARSQRRTANTFADDLWQQLRNRRRVGMNFRREHPFGPYTLDFFCAQAKLCVEVDGKDHFTEQGRAYDQARDAWLRQQGLAVLRFTGKQVELEMENVLASIDDALKISSPLDPSPLVSKTQCTEAEGSQRSLNARPRNA